MFSFLLVLLFGSGSILLTAHEMQIKVNVVVRILSLIILSLVFLSEV